MFWHNSEEIPARPVADSTDTSVLEMAEAAGVSKKVITRVIGEDRRFAVSKRNPRADGNLTDMYPPHVSGKVIAAARWYGKR